MILFIFLGFPIFRVVDVCLSRCLEVRGMESRDVSSIHLYELTVFSL